VVDRGLELVVEDAWTVLLLDCAVLLEAAVLAAFVAGQTGLDTTGTPADEQRLSAKVLTAGGKVC